MRGRSATGWGDAAGYTVYYFLLWCSILAMCNYFLSHDQTHVISAIDGHSLWSASHFPLLKWIGRAKVNNIYCIYASLLCISGINVHKTSYDARPTARWFFAFTCCVLISGIRKHFPQSVLLPSSSYLYLCTLLCYYFAHRVHKWHHSEPFNNLVQPEHRHTQNTRWSMILGGKRDQVLHSVADRILGHSCEMGRRRIIISITNEARQRPCFLRRLKKRTQKRHRGDPNVICNGLVHCSGQGWAAGLQRLPSAAAYHPYRTYTPPATFSRKL